MCTCHGSIGPSLDMVEQPPATGHSYRLQHTGLEGARVVMVHVLSEIYLCRSSLGRFVHERKCTYSDQCRDYKGYQANRQCLMDVSDACYLQKHMGMCVSEYVSLTKRKHLESSMD